MIDLLATAIVLPPLLAALWIGAGAVLGFNRGEAGEPQTARVAVGAAALSLAAVLLLDLTALVAGAPGQVTLGTWLASGAVRVPVGFTLDPLGLAMATVAAPICLATLRFSVNYLHREAGFQRFFFGLSLFTAGMLLIVTAGNAVLAFVGWELAGLSSYLLIAYAYERPQATENANRAFITNRIGDGGFIVAIFLCFAWLGTTEWPAMAAASGGLDRLSAGMILLAFTLAALAKSALVPFAAWIARALEGPTPSSAVFYGSLMVHAGVYLLIRLGPLFEQSPFMRLLLVVLGIATTLYGWLSGLTQADVKSSLMFSATAQIGLMVVWCGLGWTGLAAWHLAFHAWLRAYQFLHAPALMHAVSRPARPAPAWLAGRRRLYTAALHRFWLDPASEWLLARPTRRLAKDIQAFDDEVVDRLVGRPVVEEHALSVDGRQPLLAGARVTAATGLPGKAMQSLADMLHWFEERLVLKGGGAGLLAGLGILGGYLQRIEELLSRPRYLILLVLITLMVIL